jgi:hypothetical protein
VDGFFIAPTAGLGIGGGSVAGGGREAGSGATKKKASDNGDGSRDDGGRSPATLFSPEGGRGVAWLGTTKQQQQDAAEYNRELFGNSE